jgi:hypothetical protein
MSWHYEFRHSPGWLAGVLGSPVDRDSGSPSWADETDLDSESSAVPEAPRSRCRIEDSVRQSRATPDGHLVV